MKNTMNLFEIYDYIHKIEIRLKKLERKLSRRRK